MKSIISLARIPLVANMSKKAGKGQGKTSSTKLAGKTNPVPVQQNSSASSARATSAAGPISLTSSGQIQIRIHVKPGAKANCITDVCNEYCSAQISAPPTDGEANSEIIKFFAQILGLRKSDVELRGGKSRDKVITINSTSSSGEKSMSCSSIADLLKEQIGKTH